MKILKIILFIIIIVIIVLLIGFCNMFSSKLWYYKTYYKHNNIKNTPRVTYQLHTTPYIKPGFTVKPYATIKPIVTLNSDKKIIKPKVNLNKSRKK